MTCLLLALSLSAAPVPKGAGPDRITLWVGDTLISMLPDGSEITKGPAWNVKDCVQYRISPDRNTLVLMHAPRDAAGKPGETRLTLVPLAGDPVEIPGIVPYRIHVSPDGGTIYISGVSDVPKEVTEHWSWDVAKKKLAKLPVPERKSPENLYLDAVAPDGRSFLLSGPASRGGQWEWRPVLVSDDGKKVEPVLDANWVPRKWPEFAPGGDRIFLSAFVYDSITPGTGARFEWGKLKLTETVVYDLATRKATPLPAPPVGSEYEEVSWSPDGKRLVCVCQSPSPNRSYRVYVMNSDGTKPIEIHRLEKPVRGLIWK